MTSICVICKQHTKSWLNFYKLVRSFNGNLISLCSPDKIENIIMPRKSKKAKFKPYKVCVNQYGEIFTNTGAVVGTSPVVSLSYLYEIFSSRIEKDVINMVLHECDFNVDQASETLMSLCSDDNREVLDIDGPSKRLLDCSLPLPETCHSQNVRSHALPQHHSRSKSLTNHSSERSMSVPDRTVQDRTFQYVDHHDIGDNAFWSLSGVTSAASVKDSVPRGGCFVPEPADNPTVNGEMEAEFRAHAAGSTSKPFVNSQNSSPSFIVPSAPLFELASSLQKPTGLETSRSFWNAFGVKHFSTDYNKSCNNNKGVETSFQNAAGIKHFSTFDNNKGCNNNNYKVDSHLKEALDHIKCGNNILIILRGLPGSGKSTLAHKFSGVIFSTDDFFAVGGKYLFDPSKLPEAHEWNKLRTKKALEEGLTPIIIDNTNVEAWEMKPYIIMGKKHNYQIVILEPDTPWKFNVNLLALRNKHNVPKSTIAKMKERYEKNLTVEKILGLSNLFSPNANISECGDCNTNDVVNAKVEDRDMVKDNHVSLKAVVHMEDSSAAGGSLFGLDSSHLTDVEKNKECTDKIEPESPSETVDWMNLAAGETSAVCDLDALRALTNNDSEDSSSCYTSTNSSSQEIFAWEAITERDHDFYWSSPFKEQVLHEKPVRKSRSADNLHLKDHAAGAEGGLSSTSSVEVIPCSFEDSSVSGKLENICEAAQDNSKLCIGVECETAANSDLSKLTITDDSGSNYSKLYIDDSNVSEFYEDKNIEKSKFSDDNELWSQDKNDVVTDPCHQMFDFNSNDVLLKSLECDNIESISSTEMKNQNSVLVPKPKRNNLPNILSLSKNIFSGECIHDRPKNTENFTGTSDWNTLDSQAKEDRSTEIQTEVDTSIPKPQRQIFKNTSPAKKEENLCKSRQKRRKSILNISPDLVDPVWEFPEFVIDAAPGKVERGDNQGEQTLVPKMSSYSQTEPADFDFQYRISVFTDTPNLQDYKIIGAKASCSSPKTEDDLKISEDDENCKYSPVQKSIVSFDKSTSTVDMIDDVKMSQKMIHLQSCFPDISREDLLHLLEICYNDEKWISNLLLDWGYKYNVPEVNIENQSNPEELSSKKKYDVNSEVYEKGADSFGWTVNAQASCVDSSSDTDNVSLSSRSVSEEAKEVEPNSEIKAEEEAEKLHLILDPAFARQLEELFGPVTNPENRQVNIDLELAQMIYEKWACTTAQHKESVNDDNQLDSNSLKCKKKNKKKNNRNNKTQERKLSSPVIFNQEPPNLFEIMDMEMAQQLYREEKLNKNEDFLTKMKRTELYNLFPGADISVLDEIFESNNYSLDDSLYALGEDFSQQETIEKKKSVAQFDARVKEWEKANVFQEFVNGDWSDWVYKDESTGPVQETAAPLVTPQMSSEAAELRAVAAEHFQLRNEYISKAQSAYCRGMRDVASFYAQQGTEEGRIGRQTNKMAAALIAQEKNASKSSLKLDLHGLHVQEAISLLEKFLCEKKLEIQQRLLFPPCTMTIITGQGLHSLQGAKLRPAVINFLRSSKYYFAEIKTGIIEVTL